MMRIPTLGYGYLQEVGVGFLSVEADAKLEEVRDARITS